MKKYKIDATQRIYETMTIKDVKINQFGGKALHEILPAIGTQWLVNLFEIKIQLYFSNES